MECEERREETLRRVRSLLKLAAKKVGNSQVTSKERDHHETEFFKSLFKVCDRSGKGTLSRSDVIQMARKHLKIAERLVSDCQLMEFFSVIDNDRNGEVDFSEFLAFVSTREDRTYLNQLILKKIKRAVRLALHRHGLTLSEVQRHFVDAGVDGLLDIVNADGSLCLNDMKRFFRKVLKISDHEASDRNLTLAFKAMDTDQGGTLDVNEFMEFMRSAIEDAGALSPNGRSPKQSVDGTPQRALSPLLGGMNDVPKECAGRMRPGGVGSSPPFCFTGRDVRARSRSSVSMPCIPRQAKAKPSSQRRRTTRSPNGSKKPPAGEPTRGTYTGVKGMMRTSDARVLNRIEQRLLNAGVDVRGHYHKRSDVL